MNMTVRELGGVERGKERFILRTERKVRRWERRRVEFSDIFVVPTF